MFSVTYNIRVLFPDVYILRTHTDTNKRKQEKKRSPLQATHVEIDGKAAFVWGLPFFFHVDGAHDVKTLKKNVTIKQLGHL